MSKIERKFVVFAEKPANDRHRMIAKDGLDFKYAPYWRWHCKASNGKLVYTSGENFDSKANAIRAAKKEMSKLHCTTALEVQE